MSKDSPKDRRKGGGPRSSLKPPDKKSFEKETAAINRKIQELETKLKAWSRLPSKEQTTSRTAEIVAELATIEETREDGKKEVESIVESLHQLGLDVIRKRDESSKLMAGLRYKTEERIDEAVGKLVLQLKLFSATEERRLQVEIDNLKRSKDRLKEFQECKQQVDELRNKQDQLRKRRDSLYRSNLDLRARETELKDEQAELKRGVGEWREKRREAETERKALTEEIDALYCRRVEVRDNFRRQQEVYMEATEEMREAEKQEREEEARQRRAERESRRRRQAEEQEISQGLQYEMEKFVCHTLISHLGRIAISSSVAMAMGGSHPEELAHDEARKQPLAQHPGQFLRRKDEGEDVLLPPATSTASRRKSRRDKKRGAPVIKASKRLQYNPDLFSQFGFLGIAPPTSQLDVPTTITELQEKLAFYESKSAARPAESEAGDSGLGSTGYEFHGSHEDFLALEMILGKRASIDETSERSDIRVSPTVEEEGEKVLSAYCHSESVDSGTSIAMAAGNSE